MKPLKRFQNPEYQQWAQSFRSRQSLSDSGREGYRVTTRRYGKEFMLDRAADKRRDNPTRLEKRVTGMLGELGQYEHRDYEREYKIAPRRYADYAWPEQKQAIEVWGGVHTDRFFTDQQRVRQANDLQIQRARDAGWKLMVLTAPDLSRDSWENTKQRVEGFLKGGTDER